jgi:hypothetical protein
MLRRLGALPLTDADADIIRVEKPVRGEYSVDLVIDDKASHHDLLLSRWNSFGWEVLSESGRSIKTIARRAYDRELQIYCDGLQAMQHLLSEELAVIDKGFVPRGHWVGQMAELIKRRARVDLRNELLRDEDSANTSKEG